MSGYRLKNWNLSRISMFKHHYRKQLRYYHLFIFTHGKLTYSEKWEVCITWCDNAVESVTYLKNIRNIMTCSSCFNILFTNHYTMHYYSRYIKLLNSFQLKVYAMFKLETQKAHMDLFFMLVIFQNSIFFCFQERRWRAITKFVLNMWHSIPWPLPPFKQEIWLVNIIKCSFT